MNNQPLPSQPNPRRPIRFRSSHVTMGTSRLRSTVGGLGHSDAVQLVRAALDVGVSRFDTANIYGQGDAERTLGDALRHHRDEVSIGTKVGYKMPPVVASTQRVKPFLQHLAAGVPLVRTTAQMLRGRAVNGQVTDVDSLMSDLRGSLTRLGTDYVDVVYIHNPAEVTEPLLAFLTRAQSSGMCRQVGVSVADIDQARSWVATGAISIVQVPLGLPQLATYGPELAELKEVTVVAREVFSGGRIFDEAWRREQLSEISPEHRPATVQDLPITYPAWLVERYDVNNILVGTMNVSHLKQVVEAIR